MLRVASTVSHSHAGHSAFKCEVKSMDELPSTVEEASLVLGDWWEEQFGIQCGRVRAADDLGQSRQCIFFQLTMFPTIRFYIGGWSKRSPPHLLNFNTYVHTHLSVFTPCSPWGDNKWNKQEGKIVSELVCVTFGGDNIQLDWRHTICEMCSSSCKKKKKNRAEPAAPLIHPPAGMSVLCQCACCHCTLSRARCCIDRVDVQSACA